MNRIACRLLIEGRVQGVGFRWSLHAEAVRLGLGGWVRNRRDGSVEAFVYGDEGKVNALIAWSYRGPDTARVDHIDCRNVPMPERPEDYFPFQRKPSA